MTRWQRIICHITSHAEINRTKKTAPETEAAHTHINITNFYLAGRSYLKMHTQSPLAMDA